MAVVLIFYASWFCGVIGYGLSDDSAVWGQFGDYMGGSLNPILSFISITLLIKSLNLQNQANLDLRDELIESKKAEKLRSFSTLFFNMISSQKTLLDTFALDVIVGSRQVHPGAETVIFIEGEIERLREDDSQADAISAYLLKIDKNDRIFGILRAFYITVKIVCEKLSDSNGFTADDRKDYLRTLINFTDFAQLRLIILAIQFMNYPPSIYLKNNVDFNLVLSEVKMPLDPY